MSGGFVFGEASGALKGIIISNLNHFKEGPVNYINLLIAENVFTALLKSIFNGRFNKHDRIQIKSKKNKEIVKNIQNYYSDFKLTYL
jgi:hypothetical protein